jgi:hypothetical protein
LLAACASGGTQIFQSHNSALAARATGLDTFANPNFSRANNLSALALMTASGHLFFFVNLVLRKVARVAAQTATV